MRKFNKACLMTLLATCIFALISCGGPEQELPVKEATVNGGTIDKNTTLYLDRDSIVTLTNLDNSQMYAIVLEGNTRGVDSSADSNLNLIPTASGKFTVIPNEEQQLVFQGSDIGIAEPRPVKILKLKSGNLDDMTITDTEEFASYTDNRGKTVYEQYYHVELDPAKYDLKNLVVSQFHVDGNGGGSSNWGYVTIDKGYINQERGSNGLLDLEGFTFANIYNSMTVDWKRDQNRTWVNMLYFGNPTTVGSDPINLEKNNYVFRIPASNENQIIRLSVKNSNTASSYPPHFSIRELDGNRVADPLAVKEDSTEHIYFLSAHEEILLDLSNYHEQYSEFSVETAVPENSLDILENGKTETTKTAFLVESGITKVTIDVKKDGKLSNDLIYTDIKGRISYGPENGQAYYDGSYTNTLLGSHAEFNIPDNATIDSIRLSNAEGSEITLTLEAGTYAKDFDHCMYFINDGNGNIDSYTVNYLDEYTLPVIKSEGKKLLYYTNGENNYLPGQTITAELASVAYTAVWGMDITVGTQTTLTSGTADFFIGGAEEDYILEFTAPKNRWDIEPYDLLIKTVLGQPVTIPLPFFEINTPNSVIRKYYLGYSSEDMLLHLKIMNKTDNKYGKIVIRKVDPKQHDDEYEDKLISLNKPVTTIEGKSGSGSWYCYRPLETHGKRYRIDFDCFGTEDGNLDVRMLDPTYPGILDESVKSGTSFELPEGYFLDQLKVTALEGSDFKITITEIK